MEKKNTFTVSLYNQIKIPCPKKTIFQITVFFFALTIFFCKQGKAHNNKKNHSFNEAQLTTGRSLQDIFAQYGDTSRSGNFIITTDGILESNTQDSKTIATLQRRISQLTLAKESSMFNDIHNKSKTDAAQLLTKYIQKTYRNEQSPLLKFVTTLVQEHNELVAINTECLRLISNPACQKEAQKMLLQASYCKQILLFFDAMLEQLWQEIIYLFSSESHAEVTN